MRTESIINILRNANEHTHTSRRTLLSPGRFRTEIERNCEDIEPPVAAKCKSLPVRIGFEESERSQLTDSRHVARARH